mgnify:CR=1 FL=1
MDKLSKVIREEFAGLCFVNLVDFDMVYGHRRNIDGYANALSEFDAWLGEFVNTLGGIKLLDWMENVGYIPNAIHIHSMNVVGVENMRRIIRRNGWREV